MEAAADAGLSFRVAVVEGDDLIGACPEFAARSREDRLRSAPSASEERAQRQRLISAFPIARALAEETDVVITGRVVDSRALTLGPLVHRVRLDAGQ